MGCPAWNPLDVTILLKQFRLVGRLQRNDEQKSEGIIYDYVQCRVPMLAEMFAKRKEGYKAIGYVVPDECHPHYDRFW
jgi:hypothetical protein